jgi:hypothetical protein
MRSGDEDVNPEPNEFDGKLLESLDSPRAYRRSKTMFWPSTQPRSRSASTKAVQMGASSGAVNGVLPR